MEGSHFKSQSKLYKNFIGEVPSLRTSICRAFNQVWFSLFKLNSKSITDEALMFLVHSQGRSEILDQLGNQQLETEENNILQKWPLFYDFAGMSWEERPSELDNLPVIGLIYPLPGSYLHARSLGLVAASAMQKSILLITLTTNSFKVPYLVALNFSNGLNCS